MSIVQASSAACQPAEMASAAGMQAQGGLLVGYWLNILTLRESQLPLYNEIRDRALQSNQQS
jgi:hypothetical protein